MQLFRPTMNYLSVFVLLNIFIFEHYLCCKTLKELDQCAYNFYFLGNRDIPTPTNDQDVVDYCGGAQDGIQCLLDYTQKCDKGLAQPVMLSLFKKIQQRLTYHCNDLQSRTKFLKYAQCFRNQSKADSSGFCTDMYVVLMEQVYNRYSDLKSRISGFCCSSYIVNQCLIEKITTLCGKESGIFFDALMAEWFKSIRTMVCQDYSLKTCEYDWEKLKPVIQSEDRENMGSHQYKTIVPIIFKFSNEQPSVWDVFF